MTPWPEPVERVAAFLRQTGAEARIEEFGVETATADDAAHAAGCDVAAIVKSLIVLCDERPVLALVPGDRRGDLDKIARASAARKARIAHAREVPAITGFAPGGVSPFPLDRVERALIDRLLLAQDELWVGAGSTRHMAVLPTRELVRLTKAASADLVVAD